MNFNQLIALTENEAPKMSVDENGTKAWLVNGRFHRTDGPAIEWDDGGKSWYVNGKLHRTDGPAVEWVDGSKSWWVNGKRHRTDGPAVEDDNGDKYWFVNGEKMSEEEFDKWKAIQKILKDEETGLDLTF